MGGPRVGVALVFALSGVVQATWMSRLPAIWDELDTTPLGLGAALAVLAVGTVVSMTVGQPLWRRVGSRRVLSGAATLAAVVLVVLAAASTLAQLVAVLFAFGLAIGAWDVAMNVQGAAVERDVGNTLMVGFHGWWSVGVVAGALFGVAMARVDSSLFLHFGAVAVVATMLCRVGIAMLEKDAVQPAARTVWRHRRSIAGLGVLMLFGATVEGAAGDWLAVYLRDVRGLSHAGAAVGYATFAGAMAVGRLTTQWLGRHAGPLRTVAAGLVLTAAGALLAIRAPAAEPAYLGALFWGLGSSVLVPVVLSASSRITGSEAVVPAMTAIGYGAGLGGPVLIGVLAHQIGFTTALTIAVPVLAVLVLPLTPVLGSRPELAPEE